MSPWNRKKPQFTRTDYLNPVFKIKKISRNRKELTHTGQLATTTEDGSLVQCLWKAIESGKRKDTLVFVSEMQKNPDSEIQKILNDALLKACNKGNKFLVQSLLLSNIDVNCRDLKGNTPLMICAMNGFCDIARLLIRKGADINSVNNNVDTALILAITDSGSSDMVQLLLDQESVNVYHNNSQNHTCLSKAAELLDFDILQMVLKKACLTNSNSHKKQLYKQCVSKAQSEATNLGLDNIIKYLEEEISQNKSALLSAVSESDLRSVEFILYYEILRERGIFDLSNNSLFMQILVLYEDRHKEVNDRDIEIVRKLIENGTHILYVNDKDEQILEKAVSIGNCSLLELLCQYVNEHQRHLGDFVNKAYYYALLKLCEKYNLELLNILIKHQPNLMYSLDRRTEIVKKALRYGARDLVEMFLNEESVLNVTESLLITIEYNQIHCFNFIVQKFDMNVTQAVDDNESGLFHKAVEAGNEEIIRKLLNLGADVNGIYQNRNPLMHCRNPRIANILLHHKAAIKHPNALLYLFSDDYLKNANTINSRKCLMNKCEQIENMAELVGLYLKYGANIEETDTDGQTVLMSASNSKLVNFENMLKILLKSGADPNKRDLKGRTALYFAVNENLQNNVETLLTFKADVDIQCHLGMSCLHLSAKVNNKEIMKILLEHDANVNIENEKGDTPLLLAAQAERPNNDVIKCLLDAGSYVNHQNRAGKSALMIAAENCCTDLVTFLCDHGASINLRNPVDSKNIVDILVEKCIFNSHATLGHLVPCTKYLLEKGGSAANISQAYLFIFISRGQLNLVQKLIVAGLGPAECSIKQYELKKRHFYNLDTVSPFCYALMHNKLDLARYFSDISFFTSIDISDKDRVKTIDLNLEKEKEKGLDFLDCFYRQPMPLQILAQIIVSSAVGLGIERENNIQNLPLPVKLRNQLMFKADIQQIPLQDEKESIRDTVNTFGNYRHNDLEDLAFAPFSPDDSFDYG